MTEGLTYITTGFILGLSGLIPGPLLTLVISETLKHGPKEGIKIAASPLITDFPIILVITLIMSKLPETDTILGLIAFSGSIYLIYLACESLSFKGVDPEVSGSPMHSIKKGIIANFLNPSPYVFWFTIGAPTIIKAYDESLSYALLFIIVFYSVLTGSKVVVAVITGKAKNFLNSKSYVVIIKSLGALMLLFAIYFIKNGLEYLGVS